ncbi:MAG: amidohydrolase family protein [Candidatus Saccharicenans sp.]|nr:amidohydrolase family protein [Candidatus Saccharicenans sp.]
MRKVANSQLNLDGETDQRQIEAGEDAKLKTRVFLRIARLAVETLSGLVLTVALSIAVSLLIPGLLNLLNPELQAAGSSENESRDRSSQAGKPGVVVVKAGRILTMAGPPLEQGLIIVEGEKIKAVGKDLPIPEGAEIIDEPEAWVLPGLIDANSTLGMSDESGQSENEELSEPNVAQLEVLDGLNPFDKRIEQARASGITAALVCPGRRSVIGGQAAAIRLKGQTVEEMKLLSPAGVKFSIGEGPKQAFGSKGRLPSTRMGNIYVIRQALLEAREYAGRWADYNKNLAAAKRGKKNGADIKPPSRDLRFEPLAKVVRGELPALIECYRLDDISGAIRLVDEFKLKAVFIGCAEGYLLAEEISRRAIPVIVGPFGVGPKRTETENVEVSNAARLYKAGVKIALESEAQYGLAALEELPLIAALAVRGGLPEEEALKAITINAAEITGVSQRIGSLEAGKDADLVIFSGHPLDYRTKVKKVMIAGRLGT